MNGTHTSTISSGTEQPTWALRWFQDGARPAVLQQGWVITVGYPNHPCPRTEWRDVPTELSVPTGA